MIMTPSLQELRFRSALLIRITFPDESTADTDVMSIPCTRHGGYQVMKNSLILPIGQKSRLIKPESPTGALRPGAFVSCGGCNQKVLKRSCLVFEAGQLRW